MRMLILGLLCIVFLGNTLCFVLDDGIDKTTTEHCKDSTKADCSLLDCKAFPDEASKYCPRTCGICHISTPKQYCKDSTWAKCSLFNCKAFPDEASKYCPRTCGMCRVCEDKPGADCTVFTNHALCTAPRLLSHAAELCPRHCNFCIPCVDVETGCAGLDTDLYCHLPQVATNCSKTCDQCSAYNDTEIVEKFQTTYIPDVSTTHIVTTTATTPQPPTTQPPTTQPTTQPPTTQPTTQPITTQPLTTTATTTPITTQPPPTSPPPTTTQTTTELTTSFTTQTAMPPIVSKACDKFGVIVDVAKGNSVSYPGTSTCPDGTHQPSEALLQKYCAAPNVTDWAGSVKVMENCPRVPDYTAIAAVTFGGSTVAGVFIKCEAGGFQAAIQTCRSQLKLYHVSATSTSDIPNADKFVTLDWKH